jgi:hypothetical protein
MSLGTMARSRSNPTPEPTPEPAPGKRPTALTIKGSLEWRAWVEGGAEFCRTDVAKLVDAALVEYLKARGYSGTAPKR